MIKVPRNLIKNDVPELWRERLKAELCPVCGKTKAEFKKGMRVYCSKVCRDEYASKYTHWSEVREKVLNRDKLTCQECGINPSKQRKLNKKEEKKRLKEWAKSNKMIIDTWRDERLVNLSKSFEEEYNRIMNDGFAMDRAISWEEKTQLFRGIPNNSVEMEVDHIVPIAQGGDMWDMNNMKTLCKKCHKKKTKKDIRKISIDKKIEKMSKKGQRTIGIQKNP